MKFDHTGEIRRNLLNEIKSGAFSELDRLPREMILAEQLGISRNHLRDILAQLEREGFITRRHGVGTLINRHVVSVKNRMDIEIEYMDIIRQSGYEPDVSRVSISEEIADAYIAAKLNVPEGTEIIRVTRICTADGKPAIYCEDVLEKCLIKHKFSLSDFNPPIFYFLQNFCDIDAYMDLTQIHAVLSDEVVSQALDISVGTPLLNMEEVDYDIDGKPVFYSRQYFRDEMFEQTVLRKKL
ncbi:GntR family transcriptional regulator [Anaerotignum sp.]